MKRIWIAVLVSLALLAAIAAPGAATPSGAPPGLERADSARKVHTPRLLSLSGVVGVGVGLNDRGSAAVVVMTERGGVSGIPDSIDGVPTDVLVTGPFEALGKPGGKPGGGPKSPKVDPTSRFERPVPIGVSAGPDWSGGGYIFAGTIGARVVDNAGNVFSLSNNHVYADENRVPLGTAILQPGLLDGGNASVDTIGYLHDYGELGAVNEYDAAIASTTVDLSGNATPPDGYGVPSSNAAAAYVGQNVLWYGRTSGQRSGRVYAIHVTALVQYDTGVRQFTDQILVKGRSRPGDSGALVVEKSSPHASVGLLFAGGQDTTLANPIGPILQRFGVAIDDTPAP